MHIQIQKQQAELVGWKTNTREEATVFHGTTMAQYSPHKDEGVFIMHKNCDKWLMKDAVHESFLDEVGWTHFKRFNSTVGNPHESKTRYTNVDAIVPRAPRVIGPGSICEIDVFDSPAQPIQSLVENIQDVERRARRVLHEFGKSEAFLEYERWRTLRFKERTETNRPSIAKSIIHGDKDMHGNRYQYNMVDNQVEEALEMLQAIRKKDHEDKTET